jgi:thioredoxin reductase/bacterioferritin-associated ferredoxin
VTEADLIVVGAGPAGAECAVRAAAFGLRAVVLDEQPHAGGQVWRAPWRAEATPKGPDGAAGAKLRARLASAQVDHRPRHQVWSVTREEAGYRVDALGPEGSVAFSAPALVAATGAHERVVPFPGWTLPGVVGLAAATVLLKAHGVSPGRRVLVAGCGPLLAAVAAGVLEAGAELVAVADLSPRAAWLRALPALATRPRLLARGAAWAARIAASSAPVLAAYGVRRAEGDDAVARVVLGPVDADGAPLPGPERAFDVDALVVGHGLVPGSEIPRLLRAEHRYDRLRGGWLPVVSEAGETTIRGLYAIGDGSGVRGADLAVLAGRRAAVAIARAAGALTTGNAAAAAGQLDRAMRRLAPFSNAMASLMALRPAQAAAIPPETVVCRCEDVTRAEIDAAVAAGAREVNQLKHFTRCGMGPCQGRMCGDVAAELVARHVGGREAAGLWTGRPPLRPAPLGDLLGAFSYADIPVPEPAPL